MKKVFFLVILLCLTFSLSGCTKYVAIYEINKKEEVNISYYAGFNVPMFEDMGKTFNMIQVGRYIKIRPQIYKFFQRKVDKIELEQEDTNGYISEVEDDGDFVGIHTYREFKKNDKIVLPAGYTKKNKKFITKKISGFKTQYIIDLEFNPNEVEEFTVGNETPSAISEIFIDLKNTSSVQQKIAESGINHIVIKTPYKAVKTNATLKDDSIKAYTWEIDTLVMQPMDIYLVYEKNNFIIILITVFVLLLVLATIIVNRKE